MSEQACSIHGAGSGCNCTAAQVSFAPTGSNPATNVQDAIQNGGAGATGATGPTGPAGASVTPGGTGSSGFTPGSVIFADSAGRLFEDNANFFWNDATNALYLGGDAYLYRLAPGVLQTGGGLGVRNSLYIDNFGDGGQLYFGSASDTTLYRAGADALATNDRFLLATPALAPQTAAGLFAGTGAPNNANGANGDFYFRSDGGALTSIYQRRAGVWVGIV